MTRETITTGADTQCPVPVTVEANKGVDTLTATLGGIVGFPGGLVLPMTPNEARELGTTLLFAADKAEGKLDPTKKPARPERNASCVGFSFDPNGKPTRMPGRWVPIGYFMLTDKEFDQLCKLRGRATVVNLAIGVEDLLDIGLRPFDIVARTKLYADRVPFNQFTNEDGSRQYMDQEQVMATIEELIEELKKP